jgi:Uma2 family endonuclease
MRSATLRKVPDEASDTGIQTRRWTRKEYHRAAEVGLFRPDERLELLDGEILVKMTQKPPHSQSLGRTAARLRDGFGERHWVREQQPLVLGTRSEPEPDIVVVRGTFDDYPAEHPTGADVLIVIEIADTSLRLDRGRKRIAYARAGIQEYWIVNLRQRQLEVYRDPSGSDYHVKLIHGETETVSPLAAPDITMRVVDVLPPATAAGPTRGTG